MDPAPVICSLVYPIRIVAGCSEVLMSLGTRGVHMGKRNGFGGRLDPSDPTIIHCSIRETLEEAGLLVEIDDLTFAGVVEFRWPLDVPGLRVAGARRVMMYVFTTTCWRGEPRDGDGMVDPVWYPLNQLPYELMYSDAPLWVSQLLAGTFTRATVTYDQHGNVLEFRREGSIPVNE